MTKIGQFLKQLGEFFAFNDQAQVSLATVKVETELARRRNMQVYNQSAKCVWRADSEA
jgi:hypothetical protein